jgi:hypothetical protein
MVPLNWTSGFHSAAGLKMRERDIDPELLLLHLHKIDFDFCIERHRESATREWSQAEKDSGAGYQNLIVDPDAVRNWFRMSIDDQTKDARFERIPESVKSIL